MKIRKNNPPRLKKRGLVAKRAHSLSVFKGLGDSGRINKPGYILVFSLLLISLIVMLSTRIADIGVVGIKSSNTMLKRERARSLAASGVNIAMAQLGISLEEKKKKKEKRPEGKEKEKGRPPRERRYGISSEEAKIFLANVWPLLNVPQTFKMNKRQHGVKGEIRICISSENGKLAIDDMFDKEKRQFKAFSPKKMAALGIKKGAKKEKKEGEKDVHEKEKEAEDKESKDKEKAKSGEKKGGKSKPPGFGYRDVLQNVFKGVVKFIQGKDFFGNVEKYLTNKAMFETIFDKRRGLDDPTEFFRMGDGKVFKGFRDNIFKKIFPKGEKPKETVYWMDIFTPNVLYPEGLNPWFISESLQTIFGFKGKKGGSIAARKAKIKKLLKDFSFREKYGQLKIVLPQDWNKIFAQLYGVKWENLPKWLKPIISKEFAYNAFSVVSYGTVGGVTQKIYATIWVRVVRDVDKEKKKQQKKDVKKEAEKKEKKRKPPFVSCHISESYWI